MPPSDETEALDLDFDRFQLPGTVGGQAVVRVRAVDCGAATVLRLRRFLSRVVSVRYLDLDSAGSPLGPASEATALPDDDPRRHDYPLVLPTRAAAREYRLEWALDPADDPRIGVQNEEMLLFRLHLVTRDADGPEQLRAQKQIVVSWSDADTVLRGTWTRPGRTPEPLRLALTELLRPPERPATPCGGCHQSFELDQLLLEDAVWACQDGSELEEVRRLLVLRELEPDSHIPGYDTFRGHPEQPPHTHPDITTPLAAARARHHARLLAYAPPESHDQPGEPT